MKRYTYDEIYERAEGKACMSPELRAKDTMIYQTLSYMREFEGRKKEYAESLEEEAEDFIGRFAEKTGKRILFSESGNLEIPENPTVGLPDAFAYVPAANEIVHVYESLSEVYREDFKKGYVDQIMYDTYKLDAGIFQNDGGVILLKMFTAERYDTLWDAIPDVLEMTYDNAKLYAFPLDSRMPENFQ